MQIGEHRTEGIMKVEMLGGQLNPLSQKIDPIYKVTAGNNNFFVNSQAGLNEFKESLKAIKILKKHPQISVVNPKFAISRRDQKSFFVSEWINLPLLSTFLDINSQRRNQILLETLKKFSDLLGPGYFNLRSHNAFYDEKKDKIIFFDKILVKDLCKLVKQKIHQSSLINNDK
jgi:hypothetical protein